MTDSRKLADCIRALSIEAVEKANSGHPGMPLGMADAATVLFTKYLKFDASSPNWPDRDRFVLSNGHGSMMLYSILHLTGYKDMTIEQIKGFRQLGSITPGHPERGETAGVEVTTGPLGQGLAAGVGMACAERLLADEFGDGLFDHKTWVFVGDGCLMEGVGQEAISLAGSLGLGKLVVVFDDNSITIDGDTKLARNENIMAKVESCNWRVVKADGHDYDSIDAAFEKACATGDKPVFIDLKTIIGYGAPNKKGTGSVHGSPLGAEELELTKKELGWEHPPFVIPDGLMAEWKKAGKRGEDSHKKWQDRFDALEKPRRDELERRLSGKLSNGFEERARKKCDELVTSPADIATRKASQLALGHFADELPELVGGSADLTGSNLTKVDGFGNFSANAPGRYFHFGVREFAMCAAANGMAAHGGVVPYCGTFLVFTDYSRNALRLASIMGLKVIYVMTHDSIGLGEDGPTHQPVEHLASLRAVPGLWVLRPIDQVETFECWEIALQHEGPSLLSLTRQGVPQIRSEPYPVNRCEKGAYVLKETDSPRSLTILATGSEAHLAMDAAKRLDEKGMPTAVVSMPCWELFEMQDDKYRSAVLGDAPRIAVEAAGKFGWTRYVACEGDVVGLDGWGVSAPAKKAYQHLGITVEALEGLGSKRARPRQSG